MEFRILGRLEVVEQGRELAPQRAPQQAPLALLLLRANETVPADQLIDGLWGEAPPETAAKALQGHVSALRKLLGAERIETQRGGYRLRLEPGELDLDRFETLLADARRVVEPGERAARLGEALELWQGEPLADLVFPSVTDVYGFGDHEQVGESAAPACDARARVAAPRATSAVLVTRRRPRLRPPPRRPRRCART
jgi:DNA-binding SARP family transcriptional activator